jgi:hypothetical protein
MAILSVQERLAQIALRRQKQAERKRQQRAAEPKKTSAYDRRWSAVLASVKDRMEARG